VISYGTGGGEQAVEVVPKRQLTFDELEDDDAVVFESAPPSEALEQAKALWHELRVAKSPPVERMDALVERQSRRFDPFDLDLLFEVP